MGLDQLADQIGTLALVVVAVVKAARDTGRMVYHAARDFRDPARSPRRDEKLLAQADVPLTLPLRDVPLPLPPRQKHSASPAHLAQTSP